jgi:hypothetical protein
MASSILYGVFGNGYQKVSPISFDETPTIQCFELSNQGNPILEQLYTVDENDDNMHTDANSPVHGHDDEIILVNYETFDDVEHELQISPNYKCQEVDNPPSVIGTPTFYL